MFTSGMKWLTAGKPWEKRQGLRFVLPALLVLGGMVTVCFTNGFWMVAMWQQFPQTLLTNPQAAMTLMVDLVMMVLASMLALMALARGSLALRAMSAAIPRQDGVAPPRRPDQQRLLSPRDRTDPKVWLLVLPVLVFVFSILLLGQSVLLNCSLVLDAGLTCMLIAFVVKRDRREVTAPPEQGPRYLVHEQG